MMANIDTKHTPLVITTPKKKPHRITRCINCKCHQFKSDNSVTSSVESDIQTDVLVDWLSNGASNSTTTDYNKDEKKTATKPCPNRLHASIVILNTIRDACRPYLESSTSPQQQASATTTVGFSPTRSSSSLNNSKVNTKNVQPNFNDNQVTYEDSFPSLSSSIPSTAAPTMHVGRKKNKSPKKSSHTTQSAASTSVPSSTTPTLLVGRKKSKVTKNGTIQISNGSDSISQSIAKGTTNNMNSSLKGSPKAKKRIKPITISLSTGDSAFTVPPSNDFKSLAIQGNISSLPSQETTQQLRIATNDDDQILPKINSTSPSNIVGTEIDMGESNKVGTTLNPGDLQKLKRLVRIYSTIIRSHLAPSLLLEIHLLVRLLSLSTSRLKTLDETTTTAQQIYCDLFQSETACRNFAAETFTSLEGVIINMGHETVKLFVALPALQKHCPELCMKLQDIIDTGNSELIFETDQKALGSNTNTPHLTLPFDHARDSRHNYRSPDLSRQFKEREELRDSFVRQLRSFQDVRGRLMEHEQAGKCISSIRYESREMLKKMSTGNILWFVNFFCDLLCQIGNTSISETDSEVLKQIGDKKRLQKLHMRFTSKSGQTNKSSRKLRIDHKGGSSSNTKTTPDQSFAIGHQEFFFIFLQAGDSYKFNIHMKRRLAQLITEMSSVNETKGLCEHISKTQMLAKFLGMLVFSPNWDMSVNNPNSVIEHNNDPAVNSFPIDVKKCIETAWKRYRLVVVIPWAVQYLRMMRWDEVSRKYKYYIDTFTLLRSINNYCLPYQIMQHSYYQSNVAVLVSFELDPLFHDVIIAPSQMLSLPERQTTDETTDSSNLIPLDNYPLWFSKSFLFPSIPHLKDLCELLKDVAQNNGKTSGTSSTKKVRPNMVRKISFSGSFSGDRSITASPWSGTRAGTPSSSDKIGIKERLVDAFFHQHKDLQQLCETVVDRAIKKFTKTVSESLIPPIFKNGATSFEDYLDKSPRMTLKEYNKLLKNLDSDATKEATSRMSDDFNRIIRGTLQLLAPKETQDKVVEVASTLSISHATQKGKSVIRAIISEEKKKLVDEFIRKQKKVEAGVPLKRVSAIKDNHIISNNSQLHVLVEVTESLRGLHDDQMEDTSINTILQSLKHRKAKAMDYIRRHYIGSGSSQTTIAFEQQCTSLLRKFFSNSSHIHLLGAVIEVGELLSHLGMMGYAHSSQTEIESLLCDDDNMLSLVNACNEDSISQESVGNFLFMMIEGSFVCYLALENALLHSIKVNEHATAVAKIVLKRLASRLGADNTTEGLVLMIRLQRSISRLEGDTKGSANRVLFSNV